MSRTTSIILAAAVAAVAALAVAGCGPATSAGQPGQPKTAAAAPVSCHQQYETWKQQTKPAADQLAAALGQVQTAANVVDVAKLAVAWEQAGAVATTMASLYPIPRCADPAGYYSQFLGLLTAAGDNAQSASGLGSILLAEAPLQRIPPILTNLAAELNRTVGANH